MKKFAFSLEKVMGYKNQVLDSLLSEHGAILAEIRDKEQEIDRFLEQYAQWSGALNERQSAGVTVNMIFAYGNYLEALDARIREARKILSLLKKQEEAKRRQVLEARKETASLEKMKEKKQKAYDKEAQKEQEKLIEEFVSNARIAGH